MGEEKRVKDIMNPIEEYERIDVEARLCDGLTVLKKKHEDLKACTIGHFHKTLLVTDASQNIVGSLSIYDLIRGLVPESVKKPEVSRAFFSLLSSRALKVADDVGEFQTRFKWLHNTFIDLVSQESQKQVKDIMTPVHSLLQEEDTINQAIYVMFKEDVRQPLVLRGKEIVGILDLMGVFNELLEVVGPECFVHWAD